LLGALPELFDRLIVAAARKHGVPLLSRDSTIADSGLVETIWD
jgi:PIN domain nuclease of toxin-antitoxin system